MPSTTACFSGMKAEQPTGSTLLTAVAEIDDIREAIAQAKLHEALHGVLRKALARQLPQLHRAIRLPEQHAEHALVDFVVRYIESVPDFLEAINRSAKQAKVFDYAEGFLRIARAFFIKPPTLVESFHGLEALLAEAFLAHRLMEEVNDRFMVYGGVALPPMDMTMANLIVHQLLGEEFGTQLDQVVEYTVEMSINKEKVFKAQPFLHFLQQRNRDDWRQEREQWPCLAQEMSINLEFSVPAHAEQSNAEATSNEPAAKSAIKKDLH